MSYSGIKIPSSQRKYPDRGEFCIKLFGVVFKFVHISSIHGLFKCTHGKHYLAMPFSDYRNMLPSPSKADTLRLSVLFLMKVLDSRISTLPSRQSQYRLYTSVLTNAQSVATTPSHSPPPLPSTTHRSQGKRSLFIFVEKVPDSGISTSFNRS